MRRPNSCGLQEIRAVYLIRRKSDRVASEQLFCLDNRQQAVQLVGLVILVGMDVERPSGTEAVGMKACVIQVDDDLARTVAAVALPATANVMGDAQLHAM